MATLPDELRTSAQPHVRRLQARHARHLWSTGTWARGGLQVPPRLLLLLEAKVSSKQLATATLL
jgi:hypothetical protein